MKRTRRSKRSSASGHPSATAACVQYAVGRRGLPGAIRMRAWAAAALAQEALVTLRLVGAREGRLLNRRYRGRDYATNVLSFAYESTPLSGDVVLCVPVIAKEARAQRKALDAHIAHLVVHGVLHLQGFDHESSGEARRMETLETEIVMRLGYPDPYAS